MLGPFFITPHAVRRFMERFCVWQNYEVALALLAKQCERAHYVKPLKNGELWRGPKPLRMRLIVGEGQGEAKALLTVYGEFDGACRRVEQ